MHPVRKIRFLAIRNVVIAMNSLWYLPRLASDRMPTRDVSPTNLSISAIDHRRSESDPGYSVYTASTNSWYDLVASANLGRISQSSVAVDKSHRMFLQCCLIDYV